MSVARSPHEFIGPPPPRSRRVALRARPLSRLRREHRDDPGDQGPLRSEGGRARPVRGGERHLSTVCAQIAGCERCSQPARAANSLGAISAVLPVPKSNPLSLVGRAVSTRNTGIAPDRSPDGCSERQTHLCPTDLRFEKQRGLVQCPGSVQCGDGFLPRGRRLANGTSRVGSDPARLWVSSVGFSPGRRTRWFVTGRHRSGSGRAPRT